MTAMTDAELEEELQALAKMQRQANIGFAIAIVGVCMSLAGIILALFALFP